MNKPPTQLHTEKLGITVGWRGYRGYDGGKNGAAEKPKFLCPASTQVTLEQYQ